MAHRGVISKGNWREGLIRPCVQTFAILIRRSNGSILAFYSIGRVDGISLDCLKTEATSRCMAILAIGKGCKALALVPNGYANIRFR